MSESPPRLNEAGAAPSGDSPPEGRCPSCGGPGPVAEPCPERVCSLRGYHRIPADELPDPIVDAAADGAPAAPISHVADPLIGQMVDRFLVTRPLGSGGFGRVYVALQLPERAPVALKLVNLEDASPQLAAVKLQKFDIEAQALARLSHPNIVRFVAAGTYRNAPYLAMELVSDGCTLAEEIEVRAQNEVPFEVDEIAQILRQVLAALDAAHASKMIHRDMKPENVMLVPNDDGTLGVKVVDFGLAKLAENRSATTMLLGTPSYMAPEQLKRDRLGPWTDIYAFGVLAFELMTGHRPYPGMGVQETIALKLDPTYDPWAKVAKLGLPPELRFLFGRTLALEIEERCQSTREVAPLLEHALAALGERQVAVELVPLLDQTEVGVHVPTTGLKPRPEVVIDPTKRLRRPLKLAGLGAASRDAAGVTASTARDPAGFGVLPQLTTNATSAPTTALGAPEPIVSSPVVEPAMRPRGARWPWLVVAGTALAAIAVVIGVTRPKSAAPSESVPATMLPGFEAGTPVVKPRLTASLVHLPAGRLERGSPPGEPGRREDETLHGVRLRNDFLVQSVEVTQEAWLELMQTRPWHDLDCGATCPVEGVSWWDAVAYANALSKKEGRQACYDLWGCKGRPGNGDFACSDARFVGLKCDGWRLPTEAEWEFAARVSNSKADARAAIAPVGSGPDNTTGIFDMLGNVREWVHDAYGDYQAGRGDVRDPTGPGGDGDRVVRGGSFMSVPEARRPAARDRAPPSMVAPDLGFRLVRTRVL
ncbi:MAG: SUMF1/EgtB/PvdO family nonheme iron enzyme [Deltaproteobacteria bacterium]|nr:SUMF1/EgtB/PvdO family nonheme iron enzyme [Deltaproteobacteria bacterium]